jgi:hypothetical protein
MFCNNRFSNEKAKAASWKRLLYALIPNPGHCQLGGNYLNGNNTPCKSFSIRLIRVLYQLLQSVQIPEIRVPYQLLRSV